MSVTPDTVAAAPTPLVHVYTQNIQSLLGPTNTPSAGALPTADRLAAPNMDAVFIGCQNQLNLLQTHFPSSPTIKLGRQGAYCSDFIPLTSTLTPLVHHRHWSEVQNVQARQLAPEDYVVASIDSYGVGQLSRLRISENAAGSSSPAAHSVLSSFSIHPPSIVEDGWHGVALHPLHADRVATASYTGRSLSIYHGGRLIQNLYTAAAPTSFDYFEASQFNEPLLVVNEGNATTIWDLRLSNGLGQGDNVSRGAIQRLQDTTGELFALDTHKQAGLIATGGVDKQVTVYDNRKWQVSGRWKNVLKYEIMSLKFTSFSPHYLYVTGLDHEIYCGAWNNQALNQRNLERLAFRGDARWVGLARTNGTYSNNNRSGDHLVGLTDSAQLYVLMNAHLQNGPLDAQGKATHANAQILSQAKKRREDAAAERRERVAQGLSAATPEELARKQAKQAKKAAAATTAGSSTATVPMTDDSTLPSTDRKRKDLEGRDEEDGPPESTRQKI